MDSKRATASTISLRRAASTKASLSRSNLSAHSEHSPWRLPDLRRFACVGRAPLPVADFRQVLAAFVDVLLVLDQLVLELLLQVDALVTSLRQAVDGVHHKVKAIEVVQQ